MGEEPQRITLAFAGDLMLGRWVNVMILFPILFLVTATSDGVERIELVPLLISMCQVNRAEGPAFDEIYERMRELSEAMGTEVKRWGDRLVIEISE